MLSFVRRTEASKPLPKRPTVLVTGAAGRIGAYFAAHAAEKYRLRLLVHELDDEARQLSEFGELTQGDIRDPDQTRENCRDVDVVLHLAGVPDAGSVWDALLPVNIVGTYNVCTGARAAGCRKVVFASSIHAVSGYPGGVQVKTSEPVNPGDLYGVTKCFGEALGRYLATQEGLDFIALRIGAFEPLETARQPGEFANADGFVSRRDLQQLIELSIDNTDLQFAVFHGLSGNTFNRLDISDARELLGYAPQDDFFNENPTLAPLDLDDEVREHNQSDGQPSGIREDLV